MEAETLPSLQVIDRTSPVPYYAQVKELIRRRIERGEWSVGDQLPVDADLCRMFEVSRTVVRQALRDLSDEGIVARRKGKGTFVAEPKIGESLVQRLTGFYQDMQERGHASVSQVLKQEVNRASAKVAGHLGLPREAPVIEVERLRFINDEPIVLVTTYLPYSLCPGLVEADLTRQSLYGILSKECGIELARGRRTIEAWAAGDREAQLLKVPKGAPLIMLESVSYLADGTPIEYYLALHRGDRSRFEVELIRMREGPGRKRILGGEPEDLPPGNDLRTDRPVPGAAGGRLQATSTQAGRANPPEDGLG